MGTAWCGVGTRTAGAGVDLLIAITTIDAPSCPGNLGLYTASRQARGGHRIARLNRSKALLPLVSSSSTDAGLMARKGPVPARDHDRLTVTPQGNARPMDHPSAPTPWAASDRWCSSEWQRSRSRLVMLSLQPAHPLDGQGLSGPYVRTVAYEARPAQASTIESSSAGSCSWF